MLGLARKIFGSKNDRELKKMEPSVERINAFESSLTSLSDTQLQSKTTEFRDQVSKGRTIEDLLPEAFAVVREASKRVLGMRHFDVQMIGGVVLHQGRIAEMKTGEGKTLVATLPVYLNALEGKGVHVVTVNDYLARRDSEWMGRIYRFLGLSVGVIIHGLNDTERRQAYASDITYGTNNEFGFDFLRDNMKFDIESMVQRELNYAIVDEVDSILIDEARTPLIISGQAEESTDKYVRINAVVPGIEKDRHYQLDEKSRTVVLSEEGVGFFEKRLGIDNLYDPNNIEILHHVNQALRAHTLFKRDVDYVVKDNKVIIVDEFTGRLMPGRRWSDGLHQAIEAKERARIENENQTLASITFQNYFRIYKKLAGMTGTADTEAAEFAKIYNLDVMLVPTNQPMVRADHNDVIYKTHNAKFEAVVEEIKKLNDEGRPVLVGTIAIEKSELLSGMLKRRGVPHHVLNAKQHEREAEIIAQAGRVKGVTVSTNMAGRGTDIMLGGNPEFLARAKVGKEASEDEYKKALEECKKISEQERQEVIKTGGLFILGTERHESRRIDNQLRGRAGRQGDPGASRFFVSLEDDLMRIFGSDRIANIMGKLGMKEDETIEHPWISKAIENAQKKVEAHNFDIRKTVLEYDDVMNQQRMTVYAKRKRIMKGEDLVEQVTDALDAVAESISTGFDPKATGGELNRDGLEEKIYKQFGLKLSFDADTKWDADSIGQKIYDEATAAYKKKEEEYGPEMMRRLERFILLSTLDTLWKDHLLAMDHLREGIGLRGYGQKDPKMEYKREGFEMFEAMIGLFYEDSLEKLFKVQVTRQEEIPVRRARMAPVQMGRGEIPAIQADTGSQPAAVLQAQPVRRGPPKQETIHREVPKVGRNDPCPCGAKHDDGRPKKYKHCHGA